MATMVKQIILIDGGNMRLEYNERGIITKESFVDLLLNNGGILEDSDEYKEICRQWHEKTGYKNDN